MVDSPSGRVSAKAPRWDLADTEGYGGGDSFPDAPLMVSGYMGIYRRKNYIGGRTRGPRDRGRALHPRGRLACFLTCTPGPLGHVCSKKIASEGFIPFGLRVIFLFFETLK